MNLPPLKRREAKRARALPEPGETSADMSAGTSSGTSAGSLASADGHAALRPLARSFYDRPTIEVAAELLGKVLVRPGAPTRMARIVEVEAYLGEGDAASHARRGRTPRTTIMFGPPGFLYVYLIYGIHHCMNVVARANATAGAVLIRAAAPLAGFAPNVESTSRSPRPSRLEQRLLAGPGKVCAGFGITRLQNGLDLCAHELFLADDGASPPRLKRSARVGVEYAAGWARRRLRFYIPGDPHVSGAPRD